MTQRVSLSILLCTLAALTAQAQWSKQDSLRLQQLLNGEEELIINKEAGKFSYISKFHIIISCKLIVYIVMCFYQETN